MKTATGLERFWAVSRCAIKTSPTFLMSANGLLDDGERTSQNSVISRPREHRMGTRFLSLSRRSGQPVESSE